MELPISRIAAFAGEDPLSGNTASVVQLQEMLPDAVLQALARRNGDSETAYLLAAGKNRWHLRWFTPGVEVDLCGHATLAAGHHLLEGSFATTPIAFETLSGTLTVEEIDGNGLALDLPIDRPEESVAPEGLFSALGIEASAVLSIHRSRDLIITVENSAVVSTLTPDYRFLQTLPIRGIIVTAAAVEEVDFVSRWFGGAGLGVDEDPVTGSAHAALAPLWEERLGKSRLEARQLSREGGNLTCIVEEERVTLLGRCRTWLKGTVQLDLD